MGGETTTKINEIQLPGEVLKQEKLFMIPELSSWLQILPPSPISHQVDSNKRYYYRWSFQSATWKQGLLDRSFFFWQTTSPPPSVEFLRPQSFHAEITALGLHVQTSESTSRRRRKPFWLYLFFLFHPGLSLACHSRQFPVLCNFWCFLTFIWPTDKTQAVLQMN